MIDPLNFKSANFKETFEELEEAYLDELGESLIRRLMEKKSVELPGAAKEVLEFAGRTNYKIRLKRPNKNVWSVSFQDFREAIRKVLRKGRLNSLEGQNEKSAESTGPFDLPTSMLLHILPDDEYKKRSFVGNRVIHPTMGEGRVVHITDTGNVEVKFDERIVKLKPTFVKLKRE